MRKISSAALAIMVLAAMSGAPCVACQPAPQQDTACCHHHQKGGCETPSKVPEKSRCPAKALEPASYHKAPDNLAQLVAPVPVPVVTPEFFAPTGPEPAPRRPLVHAPPDLYLLHSILLV